MSGWTERLSKERLNEDYWAKLGSGVSRDNSEFRSFVDAGLREESRRTKRPGSASTYSCCEFLSMELFVTEVHHYERHYYCLLRSIRNYTEGVR